ARPRPAGRCRLQAPPDRGPRRSVRFPGAGQSQAVKPMTSVDYLLPILFVITLFLNIRASFKLGLYWRGMLTTVRFVREAYARLAGLPGEDALERDQRAPIFLHLVPAYPEPDIAGTLRALCVSRYLHSYRP